MVSMPGVRGILRQYIGRWEVIAEDDCWLLGRENMERLKRVWQVTAWVLKQNDKLFFMLFWNGFKSFISCFIHNTISTRRLWNFRWNCSRKAGKHIATWAPAWALHCMATGLCVGAEEAQCPGTRELGTVLRVYLYQQLHSWLPRGLKTLHCHKSG